MKTKISFTNPDTESDIICGDSVFEAAIAPHLAAGHPRIFAVIDRNAYQHHTEILKSLTDTATVHLFPAGEEHKSYDNAVRLMRWLLENRADRNSLLVGAGGGVVTDITGFVAATFMRGIPFVAVATTLVGQVDAAIGGKTAVNLDATKNIVGAFHFPRSVICDSRFLRTLEDQQIRDGLVEAYKILAAYDRNAWDAERENLSDYLAEKCLTPLVERVAALKCEVVNADPLEQDLRKVLNFGHTAGHAIEATTGVSHGHAIAIGLLIALELSTKITGLSSAEARQIGNCFRLLYRELPEAAPAAETLWERMQRDKKKSGDEINFVLLKRCGEHVVKAVDYPQFLEALASVRSQLKPE